MKRYDCEDCIHSGKENHRENKSSMTTYKFSDSKGNICYGEFKSRDAACEYAYKAGLCFEGRI